MVVVKQELDHDCCQTKMAFLVLLSLVAVEVEGKDEREKKNREEISNKNTAKQW